MASLEERQQMLLDDPDLSVVEPHRVFCNRCEKWLKLDETKLYAASVWRCHKNTKSHNARPPNLSAPAPHLLKDGKLMVPSNQRDADKVQLCTENASSASAPAAIPPILRLSRIKQGPRKTLPQMAKRTEPDGTSSSAITREDKVQLGTENVSSVSAPEAIPTSTSRILPPTKKTIPSEMLKRMKLKRNAESSSPIATAPTAATFTYSPPMTRKTGPSRLHGADARSKDSPRSECNLSHILQEVMPPPPTPLVAQKCVVVPPVAHSNSSGSPTQPPGPPPTLRSNHVTRVRSVSISGKDGETLSASTSTSRVAVPSPERLSPHRKASYKALIAETYIGELEPFRAFCTLCDRWVDLSSRTPYSYGVWKGHVRKTDKHNRLQTGNTEDDYDTASDHSHEDLGAPPVPEAAPDNGLIVDDTPASNKHNKTPIFSTLSLLKGKPDICSSPVDQNVTGCSPGSKSLENGCVQPQDTTSLPDSQNSIAPKLPPEAGAFSAALNPFTLKATTEDSFGPRNRLELDDLPGSKESQAGLFEADDMSVLTESSEEEPPKESLTSQASPPKTPAILALEKRREAMLTDPDAAIVESRRVKCGLCDRWIKGSNTQEYSSHHWLKHKRKCTRVKTDQSERYSEPAEARKAHLEADSSLNILEPHRALCGLCNKWVKLCSRSRYSASHWVQHKKKCLAQQNKAETSAQQEPAESPVLSGNEKRSYHKVPPPPTTPESRRAALAADPDVLQLFPDRVQCRPCGRWIKLSLPVEYSPSHWLNHKEACPGQTTDSPSKVQAALEARKKTLEEDPDVAEIEPHRVRCAVCNLWIRLRQDCSYSLGKWVKHQKRCGRHAGTQIKNGHEADEADNESDDLDDDQEAMDVEDVLQGTSNSVRDPGRRSSSCECDEGVDVEMTENQLNISSREESADSAEGTQDGKNNEVEKHDAVEFRRRKLLEDPDVLEPEPQSVVCRRCQSRVELEGSDPYMIEQWLAHKETSHGQTAHLNGAQSGDITARKPASRVSKTQIPEIRKNAAVSRPIRPLPRSKGKALGYRRVPSPMTLPPLPLRPRWPGEDERKQQFIDDPDVERIEPHRLLCKHCNCWIKLHPIIRYSQSVWPRHKASCKDIQLVIPGDARIRARSEKEDARKQMLDDDAYATDISPHRVTCKACGTNIRLDTTYKYEGSHWRAHRARCPRIPFHDRVSKKRRAAERRAREALQNLDSPSQVHERVAVIDSSDSDDSDASSVPRPRPTSFFTAPLEINPTQMFKRRSRAIRPSVSALAVTAKAQTEADITAHLNAIAAELTSSDRLMIIIESAGDGVTSDNLLVSERQHNADKPQLDDDISGPQEDMETLPTRRPSPSPGPVTWIPRKRTREEEAEFDAFFDKRPVPPTPPRANSKVRVCKLGKEAMEVVD